MLMMSFEKLELKMHLKMLSEYLEFLITSKSYYGINIYDIICSFVCWLCDVYYILVCILWRE